MKLLLVVLLATFVALCTSENIISFRTPSPVPEKMQTATTDDKFLYVVTYNDPAKIIKYKLGTMERVDTMQFAVEQNFTFATAATVDTKKKYLYVYGYQSLLAYDPNSKYVGVPAVARVSIQNGEFELDSIQAVPKLNNYDQIRNIFVNEDYIYYTFTSAVSRSPINDLTSVEIYETGLPDYLDIATSIATDPSDASQRIAYVANGTETLRFKLKTFEKLPSITLSGFFDGNYVYSSYNTEDSKRNKQAYITRTDLSTQERVDVPIGPLQAYLAGVSYVVSFTKDTITNKLYALYRSEGTNVWSPHGFTDLSDATVYVIDDVTLTTTSTITLPDTNSYRGETSSTPPPIFTLIANGNAYVATYKNVLWQYSLSSAEQPIKITLPMYGIDTAISMIARQNNLYYFSSKMGVVRYNFATGATSVINNVTSSGGWMHVDQNERYLYLQRYSTFIKYDLATGAELASRQNIQFLRVHGTYSIDGVEYFLAGATNSADYGIYDYDNGKFIEIIARPKRKHEKIAYAVDSSNAIYYATYYDNIVTVSRSTKQGLQDLFTFYFGSMKVYSIAIDGDILYVAQPQKLYRFNVTLCSANATLEECEPMNSFNSGANSYLESYLVNELPLMFPNGPYMFWSNIITGELISVHKETFCVEKIETYSRARAHNAAMSSDGTIFFGGYRASDYIRISSATAASNIGVVKVTNNTNVCKPATPVQETPRPTAPTGMSTDVSTTTVSPIEIPRNGANVVLLSNVLALVLGIMLL
jgi:hypothetical protein